MEITWRGMDYNFQPKTLKGGGDKWTHNSNINAPIFGSDTESVNKVDRYEPQCFTISAPSGEDRIIYLPENDFSLYYYMEDFVLEYANGILSAEERHAFNYLHNLEYDWLQFIKNYPLLLEMAKIGVGLDVDKELFSIRDYKVTLRKNALFTGSAPHLTMRISIGKDFFDLHWRDTFSFFPGTLAKVAKELGLEVQKAERQEDLGQVDYRDIPDDNPRKIEFEEYAKLDSKVTRLAGEKIRELHKSSGMTKIRVSAPSYAIAKVFHLMDEEQAIVTGINDQKIMQLVFDTYRGGRTGGIYHGAVENLSVLDFHSSYPASMLSLPSFSPSMEYVSVEDLSVENVLDILRETGNAFLRVSGTERDRHYPGLITTLNGKLTPIYGDFHNIATTGVELLTAYNSGTLDIKEVHEMVVLLDMEDEPFLPFKTFAETAYTRKNNSPKGSVEYASAKLELNSAYGKLIESRLQTLIGATDSRIILPIDLSMEKEFGNYYYQKYLTALEEGCTLLDKLEEISLELLENLGEEVLQTLGKKMFGDMTISGRIYGRHVVPAAAALITGYSRARLIAGAKALKALYWDTDSLFFKSRPLEEINAALAVATKWLPPNTVPLVVGDNLGELGFDIQNAKGFLAGVKRYYLVGESDGEVIEKSATHGIPALPKDQTARIISALATGSNYNYESKPKPLKSKEAKSHLEIGSFQSRKYESQFNLDERLNWIETPNGWHGVIMEFESLIKSSNSNKNRNEKVEKLVQNPA